MYLKVTSSDICETCKVYSIAFNRLHNKNKLLINYRLHSTNAISFTILMGMSKRSGQN